MDVFEASPLTNNENVLPSLELPSSPPKVKCSSISANLNRFLNSFGCSHFTASILFGIFYCYENTVCSLYYLKKRETFLERKAMLSHRMKRGQVPGLFRVSWLQNYRVHNVKNRKFGAFLGFWNEWNMNQLFLSSCLSRKKSIRERRTIKKLFIVWWYFWKTMDKLESTCEKTNGGKLTKRTNVDRKCFSKTKTKFLNLNSAEKLKLISVRAVRQQYKEIRAMRRSPRLSQVKAATVL